MFEWVVVGDFKFSMGYIVDYLIVLMLVIVIIVVFLVMVYINGYMVYDFGYVCFYVYLSLFSFLMLGLVVFLNLV